MNLPPPIYLSRVQVAGEEQPLSATGALRVPEFELPAAGLAEVAVCDVAGRVVKILTRATTPAGPHRVEWDGRDESGVPVASGVYYYSLQIAQGRWMKRMVLLR